MLYLLLIVVWLINLIFNIELGYRELFPLWKHLTYSLAHANVVHLLLNTVALFFVLRSLRPALPSRISITVMYVSAVVASFFVYYDGKLIVGASGMVYAGLGVLHYAILQRKLVFNTRTDKHVFYVSLVLAIVLGFAIPNIAGLLHLASFVVSFFICLLFRQYIFNNK